MSDTISPNDGRQFGGFDETLLRKPFDLFGQDHHHFAVGRQIHTNTYYYEKYFFQLQERCEEMASALADTILKGGFPRANLTLLGMGGHCGQFLHATVLRLKQEMHVQDDDESINYAVLDNADKEYSFVFTPRLNENVIIILPLTFTFSRCFEIADYLMKVGMFYKRLPDIPLNICKQFITLFLVADTNLHLEHITSRNEKIVIKDIICHNKSSEGNPDFLSKLYKAFGWHSIDQNGVRFVSEGRYSGFSARYIHHVNATLYPAEQCSYCFPTEDPSKELSIFPTRKHYDTPNVIFNSPMFKNTIGALSKATFEDIFEKHQDTGHLYGHLKFEANSYLHYIERDKFYINNKKEILEFFRDAVKDSYPELTAKNSRLLIITPINPKSTTILEDMISFGVFPPQHRTFIIYTDPNNEFIENFLSNNRGELQDYSTVLFFDYLISGGKIFKVISDYLKHVRREGFNGMLTLIDRTTTYSKAEILRKLSLDEQDAGRFISYFKLNVPLLDAMNSGNPIAEKNERLIRMFGHCHLDGLKLAINNELRSGEPLDLPEMAEVNALYDDDTRYINLLKLKISHELAGLLAVPEAQTDDQHPIDIAELSERAIKQLNVNKCFLERAQKIIIKTLAYPPFKFYENIYVSVFKYVRDKLIQLSTALKADNYVLKNDHELSTYRFYLKMSVELNGNFMFSPLYFETLQGIYAQQENTKNKYLTNVGELMLLFKQSIFQSAARTIKLESLLNSKRFLPKPIVFGNLPIGETINDPYYLIGRLLKAENTFILDELITHFLESIKAGSIKGGDATFDKFFLRKQIQQLYFSPTSDLTDRVIRNLRSFLDVSRGPGKNEDKSDLSAIERAVEQMLVTIYRLESSNAVPMEFLTEAKEIIREACLIMGEDIEFSFCIEFRPLRAKNMHSKEYSDNMYILSSRADLQMQRIHKQGLINHMLFGLNELTDKNLQTFLAVIKDDDGTYKSFRNDYVSADPQLRETVERVSINDTFPLDLINSDVGVVPRDAGMSILLRFADMNTGDVESVTGKAVLILTTKRAPTTQSLTDFLHIERVRLLLLLKKQMLKYLNTQFENEAFIDMLTGKENVDKARLMSHGLDNYFKAASTYTEKNKVLPWAEKEAHNFVLHKIKGHFLSMREFAGSTENDVVELATQSYSSAQIQVLFKTMMEVPYLARREFLNGEWKLDIVMDEDINCVPELFNLVIPEIFTNMRRAALQKRSTVQYFKIELINNELWFENAHNPAVNTGLKKYKPWGGKVMCNTILKKHGYAKLDLVELENPDRVRTILNLNRKYAN